MAPDPWEKPSRGRAEPQQSLHGGAPRLLHAKAVRKTGFVEVPSIDRPNQVWSTDITYLPMNSGFLYLVAVIDWHSRYVLSWGLSNTLDATFCIEALEEALSQGTPEIFNTDQGSQFTSKAFLGPLKDREIRISMDGRGRALDNIFVERFWRTLKYEWLYLNDYQEVRELKLGLREYMKFYNEQRLHSSLRYRTPQEVHFTTPGSMAV